MANTKKASRPATKSPSNRQVESAYKLAREQFAAIGVDADKAVREALAIAVSVHCWQADDVVGLEVHEEGVDSGGLQATGNYPGAARNGDEVRQDFDQAAKLIPGKLRFNVHAMYAETGGHVVDRDALEPEHFARWIDWSKSRRRGLDFNPTLFSHPMVKDGLTLGSASRAVREFWIQHCIACRKIAKAMAKELGPCGINIWIPDGRKDSTADRSGPRKRLVASLDRILKTKMSGVIDSVEGKLFGIGAEDYTVGSNEFYMLYAATRKIALCLDMGHFHPTESVADKVSAVLPFVPKLLLHVSRGIRWDSDHVVLFTDEVKAVCDEAVRSGAMHKILWAQDYFDASINRVAAWVIGTRALRKALLYALLEPSNLHVKAEYAGDGAGKLGLLERRNEMPWGAVWDYACLRANRPVGASWLDDIRAYETKVLAGRT